MLRNIGYLGLKRIFCGENTPEKSPFLCFFRTFLVLFSAQTGTSHTTQQLKFRRNFATNLRDKKRLDRVLNPKLQPQNANRLL